MKNHLIRNVAFCCAFLLLFSCDQHDNIEPETRVTAPNLQFKTVPYKSLEQTNPDALKSLKRAIAGSEGHQLRGANENNTYEIDSTYVQHIIADNGYESFTFSVIPQPDHDYFQNILVAIKPDGETLVTLVEYGLTTTVSEIGSHNFHHYIESSQFMVLTDPTLIQAKEGLDYLNLGFCLTVGYWTTVDKCQGELVTPGERPDCFGRDGTRLTREVFIVLAQDCGGGGPTSDPWIPPVFPLDPMNPVPGGTYSGPDLPPVITTPTFVDRRLGLFIKSLPPASYEWFIWSGDPDAVVDFQDYLQENDYSPESVEQVKDLINQIIEDPGDDNFEIDSGDPLYVYTDISKVLKIFNKSQPAVFTLYVDQPVPNTPEVIDGNDPGHVFISIRQGNVIRVIGYHPYESVNIISTSTTGVWGNDSGHEYNVKIALTISPERLVKLINYINAFPTNYNLNSLNCTDFGIGASKAAGVPLPSAYSKWFTGGGDNPGKLGHILQHATMGPGISRTVGAGNAPINSTLAGD